MNLLRIFLDPRKALTGGAISLILFDANYYMMANLPGFKNNMCVMGASLTAVNVVFSLILSVFVGVSIVGVWELYKQKRANLKATSMAGLGGIFGFLTVFCTLCTLPVISAFGISIGLGLFVFYNSFFKVLSLLLMVVGLFLLDRQLDGKCLAKDLCNINSKFNNQLK